MLCIKNGMVHDAIHQDPYIADVLIDNGRIISIENGLNISDAEVYDAEGMEVYPGFIDAHTHIGLFGISDPHSKDDVEKYQRCTPGNRVVDAIDPLNEEFENARKGGVTSVCCAPGSVNCIGGTAVAMKTWGHRVDDMIIKYPVAMKAALGENPKAKLQASLTTRMTILADIRRELYKARDYMQRKDAAAGDVLRMPAYDEGLEALIPVIKAKLPLKIHAHRASDIFAAIRLAKEFGLKITLEHVSQCGLIVDDLAKEGYPLCVGPYVKPPAKSENADNNVSDIVRLIKAGCHVSVMTDSPIISERELPLCAGMLIREGLSEFEALKTITINAAEHIGVSDRVGSIEVGKDADLVIAKGNPLKMGVIKVVLIDGEIRYHD